MEPIHACESSKSRRANARRQEKYSVPRTKDVAARRAFKGSLKRADDAQANAAVEMKLHEHDKLAARK